MGFTGNIEPSFIQPKVVAVNEPLLNQSKASSKSNWLILISSLEMKHSRDHNQEIAITLSIPLSMAKWIIGMLWNDIDNNDHYFSLTKSPLTLLLRIENIWVKSCLKRLVVNYVLALAIGYFTHKRTMMEAYSYCYSCGCKLWVMLNTSCL
ncbi:hypothetical protein CXB51_026257 [Gossypium anomalum]|uniref:Uncharacterized protein n=1 Tax=Gossypium anomalum TaxID=47600 RepID=A0A8J6CT38_9ROSI|nr:hypothetical protein CXB51_026257 [Gossypium anomalum]